MQKILFSQDVTYQLKLNSESKSGSSDTKLQAQIPATSCFFALIGERDKFPLLHFEFHACDENQGNCEETFYRVREAWLRNRPR